MRTGGLWAIGPRGIGAELGSGALHGLSLGQYYSGGGQIQRTPCPQNNCDICQLITQRAVWQYVRWVVRACVIRRRCTYWHERRRRWAWFRHCEPSRAEEIRRAHEGKEQGKSTRALTPTDSCYTPRKRTIGESHWQRRRTRTRARSRASVAGRSMEANPAHYLCLR